MPDTPLGDIPAVALVDEAATSVVGTVNSKFQEAETGRYQHEQRWLRAYKNFRGIYDSTTQFRDSENSKVFIKITKTKVLASYGQMIDVLFANKKFPIVVESSPVPEGVAEFAHLDVSGQGETPPPVENPYGFPGDGRDLPPGATEASPLGGLADKYEGANLQEGPSRMGEPQISPAREAARLMEKEIHDQLHENNAPNILRHSLFECALLGTGIIKGPLNETKTLHRWDADKNYNPSKKLVPRLESVSCWNFYPDPSGTSIEDCSYVIQRHRLNRSQMRDLMDKPFFDPEAVAGCLDMGPNYDEKYFEDTIRSENLESLVTQSVLKF